MGERLTGITALQRLYMTLLICLGVLLLCFPPYFYPSTLMSPMVSAGHHFILSPPVRAGARAMINAGRLFLYGEALLIAGWVVMGMAWKRK